MRQHLAIWAVVLGCGTNLLAAPPTLTHLFPAGGQRGQTLTVTAVGSFTPWPVQAWCDVPGVTVACGKDPGKLSIAIGPAVPPGPCWIRLFNSEGASEARPFLVGTLPEILDQEPNDDFKKPHAVGEPAIINGKLEKPGDVDCFAVKLTKGQSLVASVEAQRTLRSPMDGVLQILSADGFVLDQNDDFYGIDPHLAFQAPRDDTYIVRLFSFPAVPDASIRLAGGDKFIYRLTLTTGGFIDHAFPLAAPQTTKEPVALMGWNLPPGLAKGNPLVRLSDDHAVAFAPKIANYAEVRLETHPCLTRTAPPDQPQPLPWPCTYSGKLFKPGQKDVVEVAGKKGQKIQFQIEARTLGFPLDPVLQWTDVKGKPLLEARAAALNTDPNLAFTFPQDGSYRLEVRDLHGQGGPRYLYRLRAMLDEPDVLLSLAADRFVVVPGKPAEAVLTIDRRGGFKEEIDLHLEGMPAEIKVRLEPAKISGAAKNTTLKIHAESGADSVPVRLTAKTQDGRTRMVRATGAEAGWLSSHLWLTVRKP